MEQQNATHLPDLRCFPKRYHLDFYFVQQPLCFGSMRLHQVGRLHCSEGMHVPVHAHRNCFELTVVNDGTGEVLTNGISTAVHRGDIYLSYPCDFHGIVSDREQPLKYDFFAFDTEDPALAASLEEMMQGAMPADCRVFRDERVRELVADAISEMSANGEYLERVMAAIMEQIAFYVLRNMRSVHPARHDTGVGTREEMCYRMMHYIDTHIYTMESLAEIAEAMCYNYSYLSDVFKQVTADTLQNYYRHRRLETAQLLLKQDGLAVNAVAELLHYSSVGAFCRAFKLHYGYTPIACKKS